MPDENGNDMETQFVREAETRERALVMAFHAAYPCIDSGEADYAFAHPRQPDPS